MNSKKWLKKILAISGGIAASISAVIPLSSCGTNNSTPKHVSITKFRQVNGVDKKVTTTILELQLSQNIGTLTTSNFVIKEIGLTENPISVQNVSNLSGTYTLNISGIVFNGGKLHMNVINVKGYIVDVKPGDEVIAYRDLTTHVTLDSVTEDGEDGKRDSVWLTLHFSGEVGVSQIANSSIDISGDNDLLKGAVEQCGDWKTWRIKIQNISRNNEKLNVSAHDIFGYTVDNSMNVTVYKDTRFHFDITEVVANGRSAHTTTTQIDISTDIGTSIDGIKQENFVIYKETDPTQKLTITNFSITSHHTYLLDIAFSSILADSETYLVSIVGVQKYIMDDTKPVIIYKANSNVTNISGAGVYFSENFSEIINLFFANEPTVVTPSEKNSIVHDVNLIDNVKSSIQDTINNNTLISAKPTIVNSDFDIILNLEDTTVDYESPQNVSLQIIAKDDSSVIEGDFIITIQAQAMKEEYFDESMLDISEDGVLKGFIGHVTQTANTIKVPNYVTKIDQNAFSGDGKVEIVKFDDNSQCTTIDKNVFAGSTTLKYFELPPSINFIGNDAFSNIRNTSLYVEGLEHTKITQVSSGMFGETKLSSVIRFPNTFSKASYSTSDMLSYKAPGIDFSLIDPSITTFGQWIFQWCETNYIKFPWTVTNFEARAFDHAQIKNLVFEHTANGQVPTSISFDKDAFIMCSQGVLYLPSSCENITQISNLPTTWPRMYGEF